MAMWTELQPNDAIPHEGDSKTLELSKEQKRMRSAFQLLSDNTFQPGVSPSGARGCQSSVHFTVKKGPERGRVPLRDCPQGRGRPLSSRANGIAQLKTRLFVLLLRGK